MVSAPEDDQARLGFYERLADAELFLLLATEPEGENIVPEVFPLSDGSFVLAFDCEERLVEFAKRPAPYVILSGRVLTRMLVGQGLNLGLNLGAPSEHLLPQEVVMWLATTLAKKPNVISAHPSELHKPVGLPEQLVESLSVKLTAAEGLAQNAWLAGVRYKDGRQGHLLAFVGAAPGAETALAQAISEALVFSSVEAAELDVAFCEEDDRLIEKLAKVALRFDIPKPSLSEQPIAPGTDPNRPPRLR